MIAETTPNNKGRSEGEARTFDCTFWLNKPGVRGAGRAGADVGLRRRLNAKSQDGSTHLRNLAAMLNTLAEDKETGGPL